MGEEGEELPGIDSLSQTDDQPDSELTILNQINEGEIKTGGGTQVLVFFRFFISIIIVEDIMFALCSRLLFMYISFPF